MKLGKREVDELACEPGKADQWFFDEDLPGFGVRVTRAGSKVFHYQYRRGSRVVRLRLGTFGTMTPAQARRLAEVARGQVAAGRDPAADREAQIQAEETALQVRRAKAKADALTLDKLIEDWERKQLIHKSANYRREAPAALRRSLPGLLATPVHALDAKTLRAALDKLRAEGSPIADTGKRKGQKSGGKELPPPPAKPRDTTARRVKAYGSALFSWAMTRDLVAENPFARVRIEGRETQRDRYLSNAEIGEVWRASGKLGWPWGPYFRFLLLTLQREAETAALEWSELTPDFETWEIPGAKTKNGKPHRVHLPQPAREILQAIPRFVDSPLVFTTTGKTPVSDFSHAKRRLDAEIAKARIEAAAALGVEAQPFPPWRLHDFRSTGVTTLASLGVSDIVADRILNHVGGVRKGVAKVYQKFEFEPERKKALEIWMTHVLAMGAKNCG
jgi:integrase